MSVPKKKYYDMDDILNRLKDEQIPSDVLGSYTGTAQDGGEPTQDGDDL